MATGVDVSRGSFSHPSRAFLRAGAGTARRSLRNVSRPTGADGSFTPYASAAAWRSVRLTSMPERPSSPRRAATAGGPPSLRKRTSVAMLSLSVTIRSISSPTVSESPGLHLFRIVSIPPSTRSELAISTRSDRRSAPSSTRWRTAIAIGTLYVEAIGKRSSPSRATLRPVARSSTATPTTPSARSASSARRARRGSGGSGGAAKADRAGTSATARTASAAASCMRFSSRATATSHPILAPGRPARPPSREAARARRCGESLSAAESPRDNGAR